MEYDHSVKGTRMLEENLIALQKFKNEKNFVVSSHERISGPSGRLMKFDLEK